MIIVDPTTRIYIGVITPIINSKFLCSILYRPYSFIQINRDPVEQADWPWSWHAWLIARCQSRRFYGPVIKVFSLNVNDHDLLDIRFRQDLVKIKSLKIVKIESKVSKFRNQTSIFASDSSNHVIWFALNDLCFWIKDMNLSFWFFVYLFSSKTLIR